jgi:hypothetical protein
MPTQMNGIDTHPNVDSVLCGRRHASAGSFSLLYASLSRPNASPSRFDSPRSPFG